MLLILFEYWAFVIFAFKILWHKPSIKSDLDVIYITSYSSIMILPKQLILSINIFYFRYTFVLRYSDFYQWYFSILLSLWMAASNDFSSVQQFGHARILGDLASYMPVSFITNLLALMSIAGDTIYHSISAISSLLSILSQHCIFQMSFFIS